ncbi:MAG: bifunctional oligoribonuclease/PAP phosphatase NrnA [Gammaproteobacteria bacterium]|nr:bifunctional oligoribonuclease/PAP phosphatase NrnA [Gammaproteobacteria bacterium]
MTIYQQIWNKIKKHDSIIITTHIRADGDCVGSGIGLRELIKATYPEKNVKCVHENLSYLKFLGKGDEVSDEEFKNSLVISVDCANVSRSSDERVTTGLELIKIDHHPNKEPFGTEINFVQDEMCACAEMIFDLYLVNKKAKISKLGVNALFTGIVTDSGRFRYSGVTGDTMKKIGIMYDLGADVQNIYIELDKVSLEELRFKGYVLESLERTENGVLYIIIDEEARNKYNVSYDEASNMVNALSGVDGSPIWVLFNNVDGTEVRCRLRSQGIAINDVAEKYGGGGHANASGIVTKDPANVPLILKDLDLKLKEYKESLK